MRAHYERAGTSLSDARFSITSGAILFDANRVQTRYEYDISVTTARVRAAGATMIDDAPRPGSHGTSIAFVHPKSTGGVLMELVEDPHSTRADAAGH